MGARPHPTPPRARALAAGVLAVAGSALAIAVADGGALPEAATRALRRRSSRRRRPCRRTSSERRPSAPRGEDCPEREARRRQRQRLRSPASTTRRALMRALQRRASRCAGTGPRDGLEGVLYEIKRVIVGQDAMLERLLVALLTGGHVLLEGVPGLAKTLTVKTLAEVVGGSFKRVQFTPDLVPADLVGTRIYRPDSGRFDVELGPVFVQLPAGRRDQPRPGEGAVGAARGDAGGPGDDRGRQLPGAAAVPRAGHAEPDRVRGHLSAARGADRPLPA